MGHLRFNNGLQKSIRSISLIVIIALLFPQGFQITSLDAAPPGWNLTWSDEFDSSELDTTKWEPIDWLYPHNNERQSYTASQVSVSDGNLVLTAIDFSLPQSKQPYTSGKVESKFAQQYGRWEVRAKLPATKGTWPAIWLLPDTKIHPWPTQGEIDFMENRGHEPLITSSAYHWGPNVEGHDFTSLEQKTSKAGKPDDYHHEFHIYTVEWDQKKLRFFVDDVHYHTISNADTGGFIGNQAAPMEINLNVAVGGKFLPSDQQPDGQSVWPQSMLIDYVRVFEREATPQPVVFRNGSFEENKGSLAGWSVFGNSTPNIQAHHEVTAIEGSKSLKIYGESVAGATTYSGVEQGISVSPGDKISGSVNTFIRSLDDLVGSNKVEMKIDFYSDFGAKYGSKDYITTTVVEIANAQSKNDVWIPHELKATAPAGAVEARLAIVFIQPETDGGAIHIDEVSLINHDSVDNPES